MNEPADREEGKPGSANLQIGSGVDAEEETGGPEKEEDANREIGAPGVRALGVGEPGAPIDPWRSRGYLPHFEGGDVTQHVNFRLADSLPKEALERMEAEIKSLPPQKQDIERRKKLEAWLDAGHGSCILREPAIAEMVQKSLLHFDEERYQLLSWVVMPNHVHVLFEPIHAWTVGTVVASWKKFTARRICDYRRGANREIGAPGIGSPVWQREYWDRYMRNEWHLRETVEYIHENPVAAGLVSCKEGWRWSSASAER